MTSALDVSALIFDLYQGPLDDFVARRAAAATQAKEAGDTATARGILTLRRPTASANIINHLSHNDMEAIAALGATVRSSAPDMDAEEKDVLETLRTELLIKILAGIKASAPVKEEVRQTLQAALVNENAADAVASRRLTRAIRYAGHGDIDLSHALAQADGNRRVSPVPDSKYGTDLSHDIRRAQRTLDKAEQAQKLAQRRHEAAAAALHAAQQAYDAATASLGGMNARVAAAKVDLTNLKERAGWSQR